ncbi:MAG: DNA-binding protein, partial [Rhodospirillaceae bacterium]|nr:DNA-binding protein [Rhodospirillaceae bacterium]
MTPEAMPYWEGLREGKLMLPKCDDCAKTFFFPRISC